MTSPWSVWDELTPIQVDAVRATATATLRDAEELAQELLPLLMHTSTTEISRPPSDVNDALTVVVPARFRPTPWKRPPE